MSKNKKEPLMALVSYESGAESNDEDESSSSSPANSAAGGGGGGSNNGEEGNTNNNRSDEDETTTTDRPSSVLTGGGGGGQEEDHDSSSAAAAAFAAGSGGGDKEPGSVGAADVDRLSVKSGGEQAGEQEESAGAAAASGMDVVEGEENVPQLSLTIENGFPPGCELIRLPPAPKALCSQSLQNKILTVIDRMEKYNYSMNEDIRKKKYFKNPSIYEKLIERYEVNEYGSNFAEHIENLSSQGYMMYDELDQVQRAEWAKKEKEKKERSKVQLVSAVKKT